MSIVRRIRRALLRNQIDSEGVAAVYRGLLGREPLRGEVGHWLRRGLTFGMFWRRACQLPELRDGLPRAEQTLLSGPGASSVIKEIYRDAFGQPPDAATSRRMARDLKRGLSSAGPGSFSRTASSAKALFRRTSKNSGTVHIPILGTARTFTEHEWHERADRNVGAERATHARFVTQPKTADIDVSILCSLWRGGRYIEGYMRDIVAQTVFADRCELIVIDAASPEGEGDVIAEYAQRFGHRIVYHRTPERIGIYEAWNMAARMARGRYLTNANLDDLRRPDSIEQQCAALDALPHIDVVYQDVLYTPDPDIPVDRVVSANVTTQFALATAQNMLFTNAPHNAPMWRASLHDRIGWFDETLRSAADYEFWLRALIDGAGFYKINDPHAIYYQNPDGVSTRPATDGVSEMAVVLRRHRKAVMPEGLTQDEASFRARIGAPADAEAEDRYMLVQSQLRRLAGDLGRVGRAVR